MHRFARGIALSLPLLLTLVLAACFGSAPPSRRSSNALDFLYPRGLSSAAPASEVTLKLPLRIGLGFAPSSMQARDPITEGQKQRLLGRVADAFKAQKSIGHLEVVPSVYLQPGGSFANLDKLSATLGLDLMVLLSYDQAQFTESTRASWTYLTVVGPLLIQGEKNDTHTVMDAVVYDIRSRALLFRAAGDSTVNGSSSPLNVERKRRLFAAEGFDKATDSLIANLNTALAGFEEQAKAGTVRGPGTPAIAMYDPSGARIGGENGGKGGGALGLAELLAVGLLVLVFAARRAR